MTLQEFITNNTGKGLNFDGAYGNQCMDLFEFYNRDVVGAPSVPGNAIDVPNTYPPSYYTWIVNTPTGVPAPGDVVIWGQSAGLTGQFGHIAVFVSGDQNNFNSFDQNWPSQQDVNGNGTGVCHIQSHTYQGVLGWLHPTHSASNNFYKGIDVTNINSVKVCIDIFDAVVNQHQYVSLADVNAISTDLGLPNGSTKDAIVAMINKIKVDSATKDTTITNLNKQIPDFENQVSTLGNQVTSLTQQLETAQTQANQYTDLKKLYDQAEIDLKDSRQKLADLTETTNRQIAQLKNTSALTMDIGALWKIVLSRAFHLS